ncbi:hypothetical protein K2173_017942 [Erythroxylum novogranatense]|uniref:Leucine-rich repeat-containing N-terminal plant-type domain-containing protein n=1 Tax=Erythroxylum novogranatense TaxID=1862640 RepID=A0AAV8TU30_9ROSI|nr:hypothetical protein K2173_017942 [Erythroxylum novogranatense]
MMLKSLLLLLLQGWGSNACLVEERVALLQLKASFNCPYCIDFNGMRTWGKEVDCCKWRGVGCNASTGRVYELTLDLFRYRAEFEDNWYFNASMFLPFQELRSLSLQHNHIVSCVENEDFEWLASNITLEHLDLSYNKLGNAVLPSVAGFSSLKSLDMSKTGLKDINELQKLRNLEILHLGDNDLNNNVLPLLLGLHSLKTLDLSYTRLKGSINMEDGVCNGSNFQLESLKSFSKLESLHLENNTFTGILFPRELENVKDLYLNESALDVNFLQSLDPLRSLQTLSMKSINASIPTFQSLCHFTNLQELDLSDNNLSGNLPHCLLNLTLLQDLDLSSNHFIGNISQSPLKFLTTLTSQSLEYNQLEIPSSLSPFFNHSKLKNFDALENEVYTETKVVNRNLAPKFQLESLLLSSTTGGGSFPEFLYHQHDLHYLHIYDIPMIGLGFPGWLLENNTKLEILAISNCSLSGSLRFPARNPNATLTQLDLSRNHLYGRIPNKMCAYFPRLYWLELSKNEFNGSIPESLSNCSVLKVFVMHDNKLFDKVPNWIATMDSLKVLDLSKNMLFGSIPARLGTTHLLSLSENRLEGPFPQIFDSNNLKVLDLSHNCLTGIIPKWIEKFYQLSYLFLSYNYFTGEIPVNLWKMKNELKVVDLSHNKLSILSTNYSYKYKKETFDFRIYIAGEFEFVVKGNIFCYTLEQIIDMNFIGLDLSCNNLIGQIPFEFGNIRGINLLNLSHNSLFGPGWTLDLSCNNLSGTIPHQLVELNFLEVFSVSYNNFSGKTPNRVAQFVTFDENSYEGNPFLCGSPLPKNCTPEATTIPSSNDDEVDDGFVDKNAFNISFSVTFTIILITMFAILYINPYWRQAWLYFIEKTLDSCYYFFVDNFSFLSKLGIRSFLYVTCYFSSTF